MADTRWSPKKLRCLVLIDALAIEVGELKG